MSKYFTNGQRIRHPIGNNIWTGVYYSENNNIIYNNKKYNSLSGFANYHHKVNGTYNNHGVSGWKHCECEKDGQWVSTKSLQPFPH